VNDCLRRPVLRAVPDEPDQVVRLASFREAHPAVTIGARDGWWQARIPEASGETVITRYTLRELLDKLDGPTDEEPGCTPS